MCKTESNDSNYERARSRQKEDMYNVKEKQEGAGGCTGTLYSCPGPRNDSGLERMQNEERITERPSRRHVWLGVYNSIPR